MIIRRLLGAGALFVVSALFADFSELAAQQPQQVRVRGTLESLDGTTLTVKSRDGTEVKINLADNFTVGAMVKKELSDVAVGSYVGVAAMPQSDGSQKAIAVSIFPESARGAAEGFRPWDARPNSTMTNATVADSIAGNDGRTLTVKYKDGEKKIVITPETQITTTVAGEKSELKPGVAVVLFGTRQPDGTITAARVTIGRGLTPAS
jgi:riboflavin synthase alpha subunit